MKLDHSKCTCSVKKTEVLTNNVSTNNPIQNKTTLATKQMVADEPTSPFVQYVLSLFKQGYSAEEIADETITRKCASKMEIENWKRHIYKILVENGVIL